MPANLPSWAKLRDDLCATVDKEAVHQDSPISEKNRTLSTLARQETDLWLAFDHLQRALQSTAFNSEIRRLLSPARTVSIPANYLAIWKLGFQGVINLNIDGLVTRAFSEVYQGKIRPVELSGRRASGYSEAVLNGGSPFILNLHGIVDDEESWVFTSKSLEGLFATNAAVAMIETLAQTRAVVFLGVSADDIAAGGYLERLRAKGVGFGNHFWFTPRNDQATLAWANSAGVRVIHYNASGADHSELHEALKLLTKSSSFDEPSPPIVPLVTQEIEAIQPPEVLEKKTHEEIRTALSSEAARILGSSSPDRLQRYSQFQEAYADAIHTAWAVNTSPKNQQLFGYQIQSQAAKGAFGRVFSAISPDGKHVAIKVLHADLRDDDRMLDSFRRGVRSMKLLYEANVQGMVPYLNAWEIPACTVMDWIDGPNLEDAVSHKNIDSWERILEVACEVARIIRDAHLHPQRVLHRDIRPANIMLRDFDLHPEKIDVVVLDFDLSWHRDAAGQSIDWSQSVSGFTAPELANADKHRTTRSALVDSFGLGMTLYFMASRRKPIFLQQKHDDWLSVLREQVVSRKCSRWNSIPVRFARLIAWATRNTQTERWDMTRILGELQRLKKCIDMPSSIDSAELLAEELACRCGQIAESYEWSVDRREATAILPTSHAQVVLFGNEDEQRVELRINWTSLGLNSGKNVSKFVKQAYDGSYAKLKSAGWRILSNKLDVEDAGIEASIATQFLKGKVESVAQTVNAVIELFRFQ